MSGYLMKWTFFRRTLEKGEDFIDVGVKNPVY